MVALSTPGSPNQPQPDSNLDYEGPKEAPGTSQHPPLEHALGRQGSPSRREFMTQLVQNPGFDSPGHTAALMSEKWSLLFGIYDNRNSFIHQHSRPGLTRTL
ncbi:unnamed protein product [Protopolystoma xenopodis]|uniref:Uncharacterized protein n=1 Tax=Protopolystoma xenopodis TaxID=117903 RepID=A0A448WB77_9PLAT|nr:unnamed protein product [Protopolystoma xenopodis]